MQGQGGKTEESECVSTTHNAQHKRQRRTEKDGEGGPSAAADQHINPIEGAHTHAVSGCAGRESDETHKSRHFPFLFLTLLVEVLKGHAEIGKNQQDETQVEEAAVV